MTAGKQKKFKSLRKMAKIEIKTIIKRIRFAKRTF